MLIVTTYYLADDEYFNKNNYKIKCQMVSVHQIQRSVGNNMASAVTPVNYYIDTLDHTCLDYRDKLERFEVTRTVVRLHCTHTFIPLMF